MKKTLYITLLSTTIAFAPTANAFDLGKMLSNTAEETAATAVKEQKKEMVKTVAKETAHSVGVTEADPYIDVAVDTADAAIDSVKGVQAANTKTAGQNVAKPAAPVKEEKSIMDSIGSFFK